MTDLLEMLCALPTPCGGEDIAINYLLKKYPDLKQDAFGNVYYHTQNKGALLMVYTSLDEDAVCAMDCQEDTVHFAHIGNRKVYPSMAVSFGGYTGIVRGEEGKYYLQMTDKDGIEAGRLGVFNGEFEGDFQNENALLLGKNIANRAAVCAMLSCLQTEKNVCFVFGVQSNHRQKGLRAALETVKPDKVLVLEETDNKNFAIKHLTQGFCFSGDSKLEEVLKNTEIPFDRTVNEKEKSAASVCPFGKTEVLGIPVQFNEFVRQGLYPKTFAHLQDILKHYLEATND